MRVNFRLTEIQHAKLKYHLHCGDGLEAIAFGLCGRLNIEDENIILLHELYLLPHNKCERDVDFVTWETKQIEHLLIKACENDFAIVKIHSHFEQFSDFSDLDNQSDLVFFESVYAWNDTDLPHLSLIMYPDGTFKGRVIDSNLQFSNLNYLSIIGENLSKQVYSNFEVNLDFLKSMDRNKQAFGEKTVEILNKLKIGIVGCSGTGSPTIEQLVRLGVGQLVLVDPDKGELANMNRIVGLNMEDAICNEFKVISIKKHIDSIGLNTIVKIFPAFIQENQEVINELGSCDFIFGCVDSAEGRHYLNLISHYYLVPLIDIGVKLSADGEGGIYSINGNIHYIFPGSKSLLERKVFTPEKIVEDELKRTSSEEYQNRKVYFDNIDVPSPAVISINTLHSSLAVCEMLSRIHPFRYEDNHKYDSTHVNLSNWEISYEKVGLSNSRFFSEDTIGIGDKQPLILVT